MAQSSPASVRAPGGSADAPPLAQALGFAAVLFQLALVLLVATRFRFESPAFQKSLPWLGVGFVVHHFLPRRHRLPFFVALSIGTVTFAMGERPGGFDLAAALLRGGAVVAIGAGLVALCHLPASFATRVGLLLAAGAALMAARGGLLPGGGGASLAPVWPILGALFMFRLIVYVYDLQSEKERPPLARSLAYFFMLPNAFFPLFPVVDWKTFGRTWFADDTLRIYQTGLTMMARGLLHLVLYRVAYYHFYIDASHVADGGSLLRFLLANYALYLRVSGQFHMIVGLLHLFGFALPRTNHHYFLAESFTDYWRRVNIYWKDFMVKVFYRPVAYRIKGRGVVLPAVVGSAAAFLATWLLHAYQSYWLRGAAYFSAQDALFWSILGVLVMVNAAWEMSRPQRRSLHKRFDLRASLGAALRTMGVFAVLCVLWSLWAAKSVGEWVALWQHADARFFVGAASTLLVVGMVKVGVQGLETFQGGAWLGDVPKRAGLQRILVIAALTVALPSAALWVLGDPRLHRRVDERTRFVLQTLTSNQPNTSDLRAMERGYYENLFDENKSNFVDSGAEAPPDWVDFPDIPILRETGDIRFWELEPSRPGKINGFTFSTNSLGLRDREYAVEKPPGVYRAAMLGSSHVMGWGVNDGETFEALAEERLADARSDGRRLEILNFGVGGYSPICQLGVMTVKVLPLEPDAIYYIAHAVDGALAMERLSRLVSNGIPLPYPFLRQVVEAAGLSTSMSQLAMLRELPPYAERLVGDSYRETVRMAREAGALPVWIYMPRVAERNQNPEDIARLRRLAEAAGFITFDLTGLWGDVPVDDLAISSWDLHPNRRGHEIMARAMIEAFRSDPRLGFSDASPPSP